MLLPIRKHGFAPNPVQATFCEVPRRECLRTSSEPRGGQSSSSRVIAATSFVHETNGASGAEFRLDACGLGIACEPLWRPLPAPWRRPLFYAGDFYARIEHGLHRSPAGASRCFQDARSERFILTRPKVKGKGHTVSWSDSSAGMAGCLERRHSITSPGIAREPPRPSPWRWPCFTGRDSSGPVKHGLHRSPTGASLRFQDTAGASASSPRGPMSRDTAHISPGWPPAGRRPPPTDGESGASRVLCGRKNRPHRTKAGAKAPAKGARKRSPKDDSYSSSRCFADRGPAGRLPRVIRWTPGRPLPRRKLFSPRGGWAALRGIACEPLGPSPWRWRQVLRAVIYPGP